MNLVKLLKTDVKLCKNFNCFLKVPVAGHLQILTEREAVQIPVPEHPTVVNVDGEAQKNQSQHLATCQEASTIKLTGRTRRH